MEDTGECGLHPTKVDGLGWSWRLRKAQGGGRGVLSDRGFDLNGLDPETASLCPSNTSSFRQHPPPVTAAPTGGGREAGKGVSYRK